jgi:hypothetical protein
LLPYCGDLLLAALGWGGAFLLLLLSGVHFAARPEHPTREAYRSLRRNAEFATGTSSGEAYRDTVARVVFDGDAFAAGSLTRVVLAAIPTRIRDWGGNVSRWGVAYAPVAVVGDVAYELARFKEANVDLARQLADFAASTSLGAKRATLVECAGVRAESSVELMASGAVRGLVGAGSLFMLVLSVSNVNHIVGVIGMFGGLGLEAVLTHVEGRRYCKLRTAAMAAVFGPSLPAEGR